MESFLSERQKKILNYLATRNSWITGSELAELLSITDRTVRADIGFIKKVIHSDVIAASKKYGYKLNEKYMHLVFDSYELLEPSERLVLLAVKLATVTEGFDMYTMADSMIISESTLISDIGVLKKEIFRKEFKLSVLKKQSNFYMIGTPAEKNRFLLFLFRNLLNLENLKQTQRYFENIDVTDLYDELMSMLVLENYFSRYLSLTDFMLCVFFVSESLVHQFQFEESKVELSSCENENQFLMKLISFIEAKYSIDVESEYKDILRRQICSVEDMIVTSSENGRPESIQIELSRILNEVFDEVRMVYELDFKEEVSLFSDMIMHIQVAIERTNKNIVITNPIKDRMKQEYPFLFDIGIIISEKINDVFKIKFNIDEISFLVCHLAEAYEQIKRMNDVNDKVKVLLVALEGRSIAKYLKRKISILSESDYVELVEANSMENLSAFNSANIHFDLVLSTSLVQTGSYNPDLIIKPGLRKIDEFNVTSWINKEILELKKRNFKKLFSVFFHHDSIEFNAFYESDKDFIEKTSNYLFEHGYVDSHYVKSVIERENFISTLMPTGISLPHATSVRAKKSAVYISVFSESVNWGGGKAKAAMMFAIAQDDMKYLSLFYSFITKFAGDKRCVNSLLKCRTYDQVKMLLFESFIVNS